MPVVKGATEVALRIGLGTHVLRRSHGAAWDRGFSLGIAPRAKVGVRVGCAGAGKVGVSVWGRGVDSLVVPLDLAPGAEVLFCLGVSDRVGISGGEVCVMQTRTTSYAVLSAGQGSPSVAGSAAMSGSTTKEVSVVESGSESESGLYPRSRSEAWSWSVASSRSRGESASGRWSESGSRSRVGSWGKSGSR